MQKLSPNTLKRLSALSIMLLSLGLIGFLLTRRKKTNQVKPDTSTGDIFQDTLKNTPYNLMANLIKAQSQVESANFKSDLYNRANNAFGMKNAERRPQLGFQVKGTDYRYYDNLRESIDDLVLWMKFTKFPTALTVESYVRELVKRGYFESKPEDYIKAMKSWM